MSRQLSVDEMVALLKAAAEPTRLRILLLLAEGELNVKDLTQVLGQSQPRISRHLKLLLEAGLIERFRDGSWAYFHLSDRSEAGRLALQLVAQVDGGDGALRRDRERAGNLKRARESAAQAYFKEHAEDWGRIRALHVEEGEVERAMLAALGRGPFRLLLDLGTGTGRVLELCAGRAERALGIDVNQTMLELARSNLGKAGITQAQVRHGDLYGLALADGVADAVVMHQVLHFLSEPGLAIAEAARVLAPGGRLLIVDFAPHEHEFMRQAFAHERLGFADQQIARWCSDAGLTWCSAVKLAPTQGGEDKLTVALWLAERASPAVAGRAQTGALEDVR